MPQSFSCLHNYLILGMRYREPTLSAEVRPRLYEYVGGILRAQDARLLAAGGMSDHVLWLVSLHPRMSVADTLRGIKANSSKWIHETFAELAGFGWQTGYAAFGVSYSNLGDVRRYLDSQEEHHRTRTFQDEYVAFLKRHGISYDKRYLWD
jgi:putative transposase